MLRKIIKEPLLHFALLGLLLFFSYAYLNPAAEDIADNALTVTEYKIKQLNTIFQKRWQRPPTTAELKKLVDDYVIEEIYYREAIAMQMDKNDTIIRRRLRQKMEFLLIDISTIQAPTTEQLQTYLDKHATEFAIPAQYSFKQIYLNTSGADNEERVTEIQQQLAGGLTVTGDNTMLPKQVSKMKKDRVDHIFGQSFVEQFNPQQLDQWQGPLKSGFGLHWVYLEQYESSRNANLEEVRDEVQREYEYDLRLDLQKRVTDKLLEKYTITVAWPKSEAATDQGETE